MFRTVNLPTRIPGKLYLHSMPGLRESWAEFEHYAKIANLDLIVCLTPIDEIARVSPAYANAITNKILPCFKIDYKLVDLTIPGNQIRFFKLVHLLATKLKESNTMLIHCRGGIDRTGYVASCVLQQLGLEYAELSKLIMDAGSSPAFIEEIEEFREMQIYG